MAMPQRPVGLDMKLSQPNKLSEPKFNFKMAVYFRGGYFQWGFISYLTLSAVFFRGGLFPRPIWPNEQADAIPYLNARWLELRREQVVFSIC